MPKDPVVKNLPEPLDIEKEFGASAPDKLKKLGKITNDIILYLRSRDHILDPE